MCCFDLGLICRRYLVLYCLCLHLFFVPSLSPFRALHLSSGWEKKSDDRYRISYRIFKFCIDKTVQQSESACKKYQEGCSRRRGDAGSTWRKHHLTLVSHPSPGSSCCSQKSARGGFHEEMLLVLWLVKHKMVSIKIFCSLPNERENQQIYNPVLLKKKKKELCVSFWSSAISTKT